MDSYEPIEYNFVAPPQIVFGWGRRAELGVLASSLGRRAFVISGSRTLQRAGIVDDLEQRLKEHEIEVVHITTISREPEVEDVDFSVRRVHESGIREGDFVVAIGGGSAIDLAKAVSALAINGRADSVVDFLEGVGRGRRVETPPLAVLAMPTTAGTGSEATKNAVISSCKPPFKKSLRSELLIPRIVLIDPELSIHVPPDVTAWTGMDAITQLIESYLSRRAKPMPQTLALNGLALAIPAIVEVYENGNSQAGREKMAHAALLSGMALANSGLGMAHAVAAALGIHCKVPHGLACAVMLPAALRTNREASLTRLAQLGRVIGVPPYLDDVEAADMAIDVVECICAKLGVPSRLSALGVRADQLHDLAKDSRGNSMDGNPRQLSHNEIMRVLETML